MPNSDPYYGRPRYNEEMSGFINNLKSGNPVDSYEKTVDYFVSKYGGSVSPQEIGSYLQEAYGSVGPRPDLYTGGFANKNEGGDAATQISGGGLSAAEIANKVAQHNANLREIDRAYQEGLLTFDQKQKSIDDSRRSLTSSRDEGLASNSAYFSAVSPDAFQSQIANYNTKVLDAYKQGENSLNNDQSAIAFAKQNFQDRTNEQRAAENTFNSSTGQYSGNYSFSAPVANAPQVTSINANLPSQLAARLGQPSWSPNAGGMSTQKAQQQQDLEKYLSGK